MLPTIPGVPFTQWTAALSSKMNSSNTIDFRALCRANLVTQPSKFRGDETFEVHLEDRSVLARMPGVACSLSARSENARDRGCERERMRERERER